MRGSPARALGLSGGLGVLAVLVLGVAACQGGGGQTPPQDTGVNDVPTGTDTPAGTDTPVGTDTPAGADVPDEAPAPTDGGVEEALPPADAPTVECAPGPTGGTIPAGTAPMQDAGPTVTSTATRPELSDQTAAQYTVKQALA